MTKFPNLDKDGKRRYQSGKGGGGWLDYRWLWKVKKTKIQFSTLHYQQSNQKNASEKSSTIEYKM